MGIEYIFYNILKEMGISINENEKKSDIEKIRYWVNSRFHKRHLEKVCKKLKGMSYPKYKEEENAKFLFFNDEYISKPKYEYLFWNSHENKNYIKIGNSYWYYLGKMKNKVTKIADCLDVLLDEYNTVYKWEGMYYFDIRKLCKDAIGNCYYAEGSEIDAEYIYDALNELIKKIFLKKSNSYKESIEFEDYTNLERLLLETIPAFDSDGKLKSYELYIEQRKCIQERLRVLYGEKQKEYSISYKWNNKEFMQGVNEKEKRLKEEIVKLERYDKKAMYFFGKLLINNILESQLEDIYAAIREYRKKIIRRQMENAMNGKKRDEQPEIVEERFIQYMELLEKENILLTDNERKQVRELLVGELEIKDYKECIK